MKKIILLTAVIFLSVSCVISVKKSLFAGYLIKDNINLLYDSGEYKTSFKSKPFTKLCISDRVNVLYKNVPSDSLTIKVIDDEILKYLSCHVKDGILYLQRKDGLSFDERIEVMITGDLNYKIDEIEVKGKSSFKSDVLKANNLTLNSQGMSGINIDEIVSDNLMINLSGLSSFFSNKIENYSTDMVLSGLSHAKFEADTKAFSSVVSGKSSLVIDGLSSPEGELHISGKSSSEIKFKTKSNFYISASGNSSVLCTGQADNVDYKTSGRSKVRIK